MDAILTVLDALRGWKTYITVAAGIVWSGLWTQGLIPDDVYKAGLTIAGFLAIAFLRAGVAKNDRR